MDTLVATNIINSGVAIGTLILAIVAIVAIFQNRSQARNDWLHTQQLATEERQHQSRPILVPVGEFTSTKLTVTTQSPGAVQLVDIHMADGLVNWSYPNRVKFELQNMGGGVALNVHCVFYGPESIHTYQFVAWDNGPIGNNPVQVLCEHPEQLHLAPDDSIDGKHPLYDKSLDSPSNPAKYRIACLTVTYHDLFGIKYVLSHKLHGTSNARLTHREVQAIVKTLVEWGAMTRQAEARELLELMECPDFLPEEWNAPPFTWLEATTSTPSVPLSTTASPDVEQAVPVQPDSATRPLARESSQEAIASPPLRRDWGEAIDVSAFYGRESELVELERWMVDERCRLVALLSRGGYGKTALSVKLTQQIARHFEVVIWRSLQHAPPLERVLAAYLTFLSEQHPTDLPESTGERMTLLLAYLRTARCLLALDNVETIFQERNRAGTYRAGYEAYGTFFQRVGQTAHRSCLLLTSREQPKELAPLEGSHAPVRAMALAGLEQEACRQLLKDSNLPGTEGESIGSEVGRCHDSRSLRWEYHGVPQPGNCPVWGHARVT